MPNFMLSFVVDKVQTKITSVVPIWFRNKRLNTIRSESAILKFYKKNFTSRGGWVEMVCENKDNIRKIYKF